MKLQVGGRKSMQTHINPITKELEVEQDGKLVPAREMVAPSQDQPSLRLGVFEPLEVDKDKLADLLLYLNSEKIEYKYHIEKQGDKYYIV